jgi:hypothetical protein
VLVWLGRFGYLQRLQRAHCLFGNPVLWAIKSEGSPEYISFDNLGGCDQ